MTYSLKYKTPVGFDDIVLYSDGEYLTGLYFIGSKDENKQIVNCEEIRMYQSLKKQENG